MSTSSPLNRLCQSSESSRRVIFSLPAWISSTLVGLLISLDYATRGDQSEQIFLLIVVASTLLIICLLWCWKRELMGVPKCCWWWCWEEEEELWRLKWIKLLTARFFFSFSLATITTPHILTIWWLHLGENSSPLERYKVMSLMSIIIGICSNANYYDSGEKLLSYESLPANDFWKLRN